MLPVILIFVLVNVHSIASSTFKLPVPTNIGIGDPCEKDINCIKHAICRYQRICACDSHYIPAADHSMCLATVGLDCDNNYECETIPNSECRQGVCTCTDTYILDINNSSNCLIRPTRANDRCQRNEECQDAMDKSLCINEKCQCLHDFHFSNTTKRCVKNAYLYSACENDDDCYIENKPSDRYECKNNKCVCREGQTWCSKGSLLSVAPNVLTMFLLIYLGHIIIKQY